jgi:hypothetical protein
LKYDAQLLTVTLTAGVTVPCSWELGLQTSRFKKLKYSYKKKQHKPPSEKKKRGKKLYPRNTKACHNISTALLKSITEIGTQSTMKSSKKTFHELSPHIPPKTPKRNTSRSTNEMLHTDMTVKALSSRFKSI